MTRSIGDGLELDDDRSRVDVDAVHRFLSQESYWAAGRPRETVAAVIENSARVVGLYEDGAQVGFARIVSDGHVTAYLADVYVLEHLRGRGAGVELVREAVELGPHAGCRWILHTNDAQGLYERFGFGPPASTVMERPRP